MSKSIIATFTAAVAVAAALLLTGCERAIDMTGKPVSFAAGISDAGPFSRSGQPQTRVSYGRYASDNTSQALDWQEGDRITIYCAQCENKQSAVYKVQDITEATTGNMVSYAGLANAESDGAGLRWGTGDHTFYAVYPGTDTDGATVTIQGKDITGSIPATQGFTGEITGTDAKVVAPDMRNMYMTAKKEVSAENVDGDVELDFKPLTSVLEFTITKEDSEKTMDISSISLTSEGHALSGSFSADLDDTGNGHYGRPKTGLASGTTKENSNSVTISFGDSPVKLKKGQSLTFTFFLNPGNGTVVEDEYVINDLTFSISGEIGKDGETKESFNRKTALKKSDGTGVAFPTHQKTRISGLMLPDAIAWTVNYGEMTVVTSWDGGVLADLELKEPETEFEYVDLGLSVLWATCNIGASAPEEYGDYFAWGATEPLYEPGHAQDSPIPWKPGKEDGYTWANTPYQTVNTTDASKVKWSKYGATKSVLELTDDAAHENWGDGWRMPTQAEWLELSNTSNTTWTGTNQNGVDGYLITSKVKGYEGNSIFLPKAGWFSSNKNNVLSDYSGTTNPKAYYWTSTQYTSKNYAYNLNDKEGINNHFRECGQPIRPVMERPLKPCPAGALPGAFSVSATKKVYFSQGNLVATVDASGNPTAWKFATNQSDCLGAGGANLAIGTAAGDVDMFGWSTPSTKYGISVSETASDYSGDFKDWGTAIDDNGTWRTLSKNEWEYLFARNVNGGTYEHYSYTVLREGLILYPDNYSGSEITSYTSTLPDGVVFLPAAGSRKGSSYIAGEINGGSASGDKFGYYWTSTTSNAISSYPLKFSYEPTTYATTTAIYSRYVGLPVRLVTDAD